MRVKRKTRRWPFVLALVGLFLFCLYVPRYWRTIERTPEVSPADGLRTAAVSQRRSKPRDAMLDLADLVAQADAEEAAASVAAADNRQPAAPADDYALFAELSIGLAPTLPQPSYLTVTWPTPADVLWANPDVTMNSPIAVAPPIEAVHVEPQVAAAFETVGQTLAQYSQETAIARIVRKAMAKFDTLDMAASDANWPVIQESPATTPVDIAAAPEPSLTGDVDSSSTNALWSRPESLVLQLEQLTRHPFTAQWAGETLSQLLTLVEGPRRDGGETAALLESLDQSADAAIKLAEKTGDEALRVELLRTHWALERRLECWTAMRDIRVAAIGDTRIASRGPLGPLYGNGHYEPAGNEHIESLSSELETYERTRDPRIARHVAQVEQQLRASSDDLDQALADAVENNYRNANVRVALTAELLNRFVSREQSEARDVHERIAGTPVRGQSETMSRTRVELRPAVGVWHMELRTDGVVESDTSSVGRAQVFTHGSTQFSAQTPIVVDSEGTIHRQKTAVAADSSNYLMCVTTGLDWVPLVGGLARQEAIRQYKQKQPQAKAEVEYKVENRTSERVDARADEAVADLRQQVQDRLTNPIAKYGIEVTPLEMSTTSERLVARLRVAGREQLAGHTPRPRALSDSLASLQVHESALTNAAVALELNGERLTASQLQARLRQKFPRLAIEQPPEAPDATVFQFASADAVQFHINDGKLELTLSITEFTQDDQRVRNFIVHAFYKPVVNGMTAELERDGPLGIEGQRAIGATDRALLHNVFKVVLAEDRRLPIFRPENPADPRLAGLMITQLVLEDGWLGVSVGPVQTGRVAERQRSLR